MPSSHNLTGQRFGRLVARERVANSPYQKARWHCRCDCGHHKTTLAASLRSGRTRSCGCLLMKVPGA